MFNTFKKIITGSKASVKTDPVGPSPQVAELPPLEGGIGKIDYDHSALVGHGITHYKDVYVNPRSMPRITFEAKPPNNEYQAIRHGLLIETLKCLRPYMDFVFSLRGVAGKEDLRELLTRAIVRFLGRYWDMPASKSNHHAYEWGLVLHSLEVACGEAEKATSWNPKTMYGTDDIRLNRDKGKVVCLYFLKGLFHDSHKIFQYDIVAHRTPRVTFDPHQIDGNILDFKMVYPTSREELWQPGVVYPGRYSAAEFMLLMPPELRHNVPGDVSWDILNALFDMAEIEADRSSAQKDAARQGIPSTRELIQRSAALYFTEDRATTKPEQHVFRASPQWFAVNASSFFSKVRPPQGANSNHGVRQLFSDFDLLSVKGSDVLKLEYLVRFKDGRQKMENMQLVFISADFLLEVCPDLDEWTGDIFFSKKDENLVSKFCPLFKNYVDTLPEKPTSAAKTETDQAARAQESGEKSTPSKKRNPPQVKTGAAVIVSIAPVKWNERFEALLHRFTPSDSDQSEGWLYLTHQHTFLRLAPFIKKIAASVTASGLDAEILKHLADNGYPNEPYTKKIKTIGRGGGFEMEGDLIRITLSNDAHRDLIQKLYLPEVK